MTGETHGRRVIGNVPDLQWGRSGDTTFCGALEAATTVTPYPFDYNAIMGVTGLAFRTRWYERPGVRWCPSAAVGEFPDEMEAAARATGWRLRCEWEPLDRCAPDLVRNIDGGLPALAYDEQLNVAVVCGYDEGGSVALLKGYTTGSAMVSRRLADMKMMMFFLDVNDGPMPAVDAARMGIQIGVRHYRMGIERRREDPPDTGYWHGPLAFEKWLKVLGDAETFDDEEKAGAFFINWWTFQTLADARRQAVDFLRKSAPLFAPPAQGHLLAAARIYEGEAAALGQAFAERNAFIGPWNGGDVSQWTPEMRQREQTMLRSAAGTEEEAVREMEEALNQ